MANTTVNKVIYGGDVLIDLTGDTVTVDKLLSGITAHDKSGAKITGTCTYDADTSDATAGVAEVLAEKTAYVSGAKITGTMKNSTLFLRVIMMALVKLGSVLQSRQRSLRLIFVRVSLFLELKDLCLDQRI